MNLDDFNKRVKSIFSKFLSLGIFYSFAELLLFYSIWFVLFSLLDNIFNFNVFFRWLNLMAFLILFSRRAFNHYLNINSISRRSVLVRVEDTYNFKDAIISGYELQNSDEYDSFYISRILKQAVVNLRKIKISNLINFRKLKICLFYFISCILFLSLYSFVLPDNYRISFNRFINPAYRIKYTHEVKKLEIYPKNIRVLEGSDVSIRLVTHGKVKDAFIVLKNKGNLIREKFKLTIETNVSTNKIYIYDYDLKSVYDDFVYYGETVQTRDNIKILSPKYRITVVKEPVIKSLKIVFRYPSYTLLKSKVAVDNGNIEAVERTVVTISGKANNNISSAHLYYNKMKLKLSVSDDAFSGSFMLGQSGKYYIKFRDVNQNTNTMPSVKTFVREHSSLPGSILRNVSIPTPGFFTLQKEFMIPKWGVGLLPIRWDLPMDRTSMPMSITIPLPISIPWDSTRKASKISRCL